MTVATILQTKGSDIFTAKANASLNDICAQLSELGIGAIMVCDDGERIEGIVSERDIVRAIAKGGAGILSQPVSSIMTKKVVTCTRDESVNAVMARMTQHRFRHMPVTENDKLIGLISIGDVVKHRIAEIERESEEILNYIHTA